MNIIRKHLKKKSFENIPLTKHSIYRKHHASDDTIKEFKSEWKIRVEYLRNTGSTQEVPALFWWEYYDEAKELVESDFRSHKEIILYAAKEKIPTIKDIEFELTQENAIMKVTYSEKPTDEILKSTADYIEGQYANGWGKGLERQKFDTFEDYTYKGRRKGMLYVKLRPSENFKINY